MSYQFKNTQAKDLLGDMVMAYFNDEYQMIIDLSKRIIQLEPDIDDPIYFSILGQTYFYDEHLSLAKKELLKAVEADKKHNVFTMDSGLASATMSCLGYIYGKEQDHRNCVYYLEKALDYKKKLADYDPTSDFTMWIKNKLVSSKMELNRSKR